MGDYAVMINQQPANDNDLASWWDQALPFLLGVVILISTIRAALRAFF
jgi:hypothetical protein